MSDYTNGYHAKSSYTKTGKKVKCIGSNRRDLTYKKVYDVFVDNGGYEFVIDESCDRLYDSMEFPLWIEVFDDDDDDKGFDSTTSKPQFKVGDKVKVVNIYYISQFVNVINVINVGDTGVIISIDDNDNITPYLVKFEDSNVEDGLWFTDKCIELVSDDTKPIENESSPIKSDGNQIVSDGGSSSYYAQQIPKGMLERFNTTGTIEAKDVIRLFLGNDFNMGNIFKAYCRVISLRNGKGKAGIDEQYDLTKAKFFTEDELNYYLENKE